MREIKFRAILNKEARTSPRYRGARDVYEVTLEDLLRGRFSFSHPEHWTFVRFTGLKDKDGKEIYEGDVVRCANSSMPLLYIRWKEGDSGFCASDASKWFNFMLDGSFALGTEVIGNIYENPNLLISTT